MRWSYTAYCAIVCAASHIAAVMDLMFAAILVRQPRLRQMPDSDSIGTNAAHTVVAPKLWALPEHAARLGHLHSKSEDVSSS